MIKMTERAVETKSFEFAVKVVKEVRELRKQTQEYELLSQLMRSATSIGANVSEATYAQSDKDFVSKHAIALKEANETKYWLRLLSTVGILQEEPSRALLDDVNELLRMITSIIRAKQKNIERLNQ